jgi:WD40 repeat protein
MRRMWDDGVLPASPMMPLQLFRFTFLLCLMTNALKAAVSDPKPAMRVLRDQCVGCHKPGKAKGGLLLTNAEKMMKGGDSGAVVKPGKAEDSLLYQLVLEKGDPHMPPKKSLTSSEIMALKSWINAGAVWDATVFDEAPKPKAIELASLPSHYQPVLALALSPDEKQLAIARASSVLLVDLTRLELPLLGKLDGQTEAVTALSWSRDGKWIVSGGFQRLTIWDAATMKQMRVLNESLVGSITALTVDAASLALFAADGEAGGAGFIRRFDLQTGKLTATWKAHEDNVLALMFSAKGDRLLSGSADKLAKLWDAASHQVISIYEGHTNHILSVAFNQDASQIATAGADREVKIWNTKSGEQETSLGDKKTAFAAISWSPDGKTLVALTDTGGGSVYTDFVRHTGGERSERAKERKLTSLGESPTCVVITKDSKWIYAGTFEGRVHRLDATSGKVIGELSL